MAEECFHLVGSSVSECDTIHGRQCMAAAYFLAGQFEEVLVYLTSIRSYLHSGILCTKFCCFVDLNNLKITKNKLANIYIV